MLREGGQFNKPQPEEKPDQKGDQEKEDWGQEKINSAQPNKNLDNGVNRGSKKDSESIEKKGNGTMKGAEEYDKVPEGWLTKGEMASELKVDKRFIKGVIKSTRDSHPEWFKEYREKGRPTREYCSPELKNLIKKSLKKYPDPPSGWLSIKKFSDLMGHDIKFIERRTGVFRDSHPEWFKEYRSGSGKVVEYYSPELITRIISLISGFHRAPDGWITNNELSRALGTKTVRRIADVFRSSHPEWFKKYYDSRSNIQEHYSPELIRAIRKRVDKFEYPPEGWATRHSLSQELNRGDRIIKNIANIFRSSHPEWFKKYYDSRGKVQEHYSPELIKIITDGVNETGDVPEGWFAKKSLYPFLRTSPRVLNRMINTFRPLHPEWFRVYRNKNGGIFEHYSQGFVETARRMLHGSKEGLRDFVQKISLQETPSAREFSSLISLFSSGSAVDILYKYHPEFRGLPVGYVKNVIADYLGNFLVKKHGFVLNDLKYTNSLAKSDVGLIENLFEVMKQDCISFYQQNYSLGKEAMQRRIDEYRGAEGVSNPVFQGVIQRIEKYYKEVLDFKLPGNIVKQLRVGREFPDLNQKINIKEVDDKHRLLIADYMGLGKSASAIIAKEYLKCQTCIVVAPNNVIPTWMSYLTQERIILDEDGNPKNEGGYFKVGQEPRVLVINNPDDLEKLKGGEIFDYILISQEKLNENYTKRLLGADYDMLIVDEVHKLKNLRSGIRSQNLIQLSKRLERGNKYLVMLSGTPIPNKIEDIAIELKLLYPEKFGREDDDTLVRQIVQGDVLDLRELLLSKMQRKSLGGNLEMPKFSESTQTVMLQGLERQVYELLLEEDELEATQKIKLLRQTLLNPEIVKPTPGFEGAKIEAARSYLRGIFTKKDKVVMFVNGYIEKVIRGGKSVLQRLDLPPDVSVRVIEGNIDQARRLDIQRELREPKGKILLVVSGQTADVGVDFSAGEAVYFYNEPWTEADKEQQTSRVYREGVRGNIEATTSIAAGTIEEGIHRYLTIKQQAIEKIIAGIPTTELEKELLRRDEPVLDKNLEVNAALARYYFSSVDRMLKIFSYIKEMGEKDFQKFLETFGREYAGCYLDIGSRSYQGNNSRVTATLLDKMITERGEEKDKVRILDLAAGPEMLQRHARENLQPHILSLDINRHHFEGSKTGQAAVGSFLNVPFADESLDYVNLGFALHYTKFLPGRGEYERLDVLEEMNRVLKSNGRAIITMMHNLDFKDEDKFKQIVSSLGFRVVKEYSGIAEFGREYRSKVVTLEKIANMEVETNVLAERLGREQLGGLKFTDDRKSVLKNSRNIIDAFELNGKRYDVEFNETDGQALKEQKEYVKQGENLIAEHGSIEGIPADKVIENGFARVLVENKYLLFRRMTRAGGAVVLREK